MSPLLPEQLLPKDNHLLCFYNNIAVVIFLGVNICPGIFASHLSVLRQQDILLDSILMQTQ